MAIIIFCVCSFSSAETSGNQSSLLGLINQIRTAPFSYALSLGYDTEFLKEKGILPDTALEPYVMDESLSSGAADENIFVDEKSTAAEENGQVHLLTVETGGVVTFLNFMSSDIAGKIFIDYLFKQELENKNFQYILSSDYAYVGFSIKSGVTEAQMNAWFFTIRLGSSVLKSEGQVLNLINQVRSEPWKVQAYLDKELIEIFYENWNVFHSLGREYSPLFFDSSLHLSAVAGSFYMLNGIYPEPLLFPMTPSERSVHYGYNGPSVLESVVEVACEKDNTVACVNKIFSSLVLNEFKAWPAGATVFSSEFQNAGLGISLCSEKEFDMVLTLDVGIGVNDTDEQNSRIYGILFWDNDENSLYTPGEEIARETVMVYDEDLNPLKSVVTNNAGHFSITLESNKNYFFSSEPEGSSVSEKIFVATDKFVKLPCIPHPL
ncbi:hypothetical protein [Desulfobacula phenolica]|uniref:hypothetical protein n=1 Tax=Desulfobacula phenolica TaxID=90732 RepID=UPI0011137E53|nr:hypothetical protein [Desulfobacula phenolica]